MSEQMKRNICVAVFLCLLTIILVGCAAESSSTTGAQFSGTQQQTEISTGILWQEDVEMSFTEPYPSGGSFSTSTGTMSRSEYAVYYYFDGISEEMREKAFYQIEAIIAAAESLVGESAATCEVYIYRYPYPARVYENELVVGMENLDTQDAVIGVIQMLYGYQLNYGLAYALSCEIAKQVGFAYPNNDFELADALAVIEKEPAYLDLNYACFSAAYANEKQLESVKTLSLHFYEYLRQEDKLDIFSQYSDEKYCAYLNQFLSKYSELEYENSGLANTIFFDGGAKAQMAWKNHVAAFYIEEGYTVTYYDKMFTEDMVNSGYTNLRKIVIDYIAQAEYMQEVFEDYEVQSEPLTVLFMEDRYHSIRYSAVYMIALNEIRMFSVNAFMHEYTHYLTEGWVDGWLCEVLPVYYNNYPVNEQITYIWYEDMLKRTSLDPNDPEEAEDYAFLQKLFASLDHEFDWTDMDDFQYMLDALLVKRGWLHRITDVDGGTATKSSFFHYLCRTYGEQSVHFAFMYDAPEEYLGKTWEELIVYWKDDVNTRLAWVLE